MTIIQAFYLINKLFDNFFVKTIAYLQNIPIFANKTNNTKS